MVSVPQVFNFLCKLPRFKFIGLILRCFKSWSQFLAFLGRRLGHYPWNNGKDEYQREAEKTAYSFTRIGLDVRQEYAVACSSIPLAAHYPSLVGDALSIAEPIAVHPQVYPPLVFDAGIHSNRSCPSLSVYSRASDRLSIIQAHSYESLHSSLGQPRGNPRAAHRQFGCGPSTDNLEVSSHSHASPSPTGVYGHRRGRSSTSLVVGIENPSTPSLHRSHRADSPPLSEGSYSIGSPTLLSSPASKALDLSEESSPLTPTVASPISDFDLPDGRSLKLIVSEQLQRYTKGVTVPHERRYCEIRPLTTTFPYIPNHIDPEQGLLEVDCAPWIPATHPDGALYFFDKDKRLFTDTNMYNPELKEEMEMFYCHLQKRYEGLTIPSNNYDLVLDIMPTEDGKIQWSYYYACHETRCLFWLDVYDANHMISEVFCVTSPAHVKHRLEALYWTHWSFFPVVFDGRRLQPAVYDELIGILSHGCMDVMTSKASTLPYDDETMQKMIKLVRQAKGSDAGIVYHTASITRLLSFFAHWRFLDAHGQRHARLIRHRTVYSGVQQERSLLITSLSLVLFLAPEVHLQEMERLWTDEIIIEKVWKRFMTKLLGEWEELILWSTVMLTANVGFLAIPGVVISTINNNIQSTTEFDMFVSSAQIASSMSILASVGSIVISLLLVRHHRSKQKVDPASVSTYLYQSTHRIFGLEPMAIIFSLPWALLMWAMVMFFIALLLFSSYYSNTSTRIFVAVASAMLAALTVWCIGRAWESSDGREVWTSSLLPSISRAFGHCRVKYHDLFAVISRRGHPSSHAPERTESVHSMAIRDEGGVV